jgi:AraC family ethanolamine operon transcriptional activator
MSRNRRRPPKAQPSRKSATLPGVLAGMEETLGIAGEGVLTQGTAGLRDTGVASARHLRLVRQIDEFVQFRPGAAIYTADLTQALGSSGYRIGAAVRAIHGMSLHRYLRLRRLWAVRGLLLAGSPGMTVKSAALANGFWHMGELSCLYKGVFGESPSATLARSRR